MTHGASSGPSCCRRTAMKTDGAEDGWTDVQSSVSAPSDTNSISLRPSRGNLSLITFWGDECRASLLDSFNQRYLSQLIKWERLNLEKEVEQTQRLFVWRSLKGVCPLDPTTGGLLL